jgi:hypothetical protein
VIHPNSDESHLAEADILQAVVEDTGLTDLQRVHLAQCPDCRSSKERLEQELARLGQLARRYCPAPQRRITIVEPRHRSAFFSRGFVFSAAAVAAAILVMLGVFLIRSQPQGNVGNLAQNMVEAERLMTEVNGLVENALPPVYLDIVGQTDLNADEDFMDFLIPNTDGAPEISAAAEKGSKLC